MAYTLDVFLAHALAMEDEAAERYLQLADMMEAHDNQEVSALFRDMHRYSRMHGDSIRQRAADRQLPRLRMDEYRWASPPEVGDEDAFDYEIVAFRALEYARNNEWRAMEYYQGVADATDDPVLRALAADFAKEESEHADAIGEWLDRVPRP